MITPVDSPERDVDFQPTKTPYDPRHMLAGHTSPDGDWISGFFDKNTFIESMGGWGKSVVTGRAKLGKMDITKVNQQVLLLLDFGIYMTLWLLFGFGGYV